jgi:D-alanine-D-alanine ligase
VKIVVLKGGVSSERDISLISGDNISKALVKRGHNVLCLDTILPFEQVETEISPDEKMIKNGDSNLVNLLIHPEVRSADFIFNALHGGSGENGIVEGVLQLLGYNFNGSGIEGCAIAMDKVITKLLFEKYRIPTPAWLHFNRANSVSIEKIYDEVVKKFTFPVVVKPSSEGSTIGVSVVESEKELIPAIDKSLKYDEEVIVEKFIKGRELAVSILGSEPLPILEIVPKHKIYDYECKYIDGMSKYIVPAEIDEEITYLIKKFSIVAFKILKCRGYGRLDLRLGDDRVPYFFEINALPGMTSHSLVPKSAQAAGMEFGELLEKIMEIGIKR